MVAGAELLYALLLDLELITDPTKNKPWPGFIGLPDVVGQKPEEDSGAIGIFDIGLPPEGRLHNTGETVGFNGMQIRVRARTYSAAHEKIFSIVEELDKIQRYKVPFDNDRYEIQAVHRMQYSPIYIGEDDNERDSFTVDCQMTARKVS